MELDNLLNPLNINLINQVFFYLEEAQEDYEDNVNIQNKTQDILDPFDALSNIKFQKNYRLTKELTRNLIASIRPYLRPTRADFGLTIETRVLTTLHFYASGSYQVIVGSSMYAYISQSSVSRAIYEVTQALNVPEIYNHWVHFPRNLQELNAIAQRFFIKYGFPGIIGCIDCTHVAIVRPQENEHVYVNRKMYHSINVQLICDDQLKILNLNARYPGSVHDSRIWQESRICAAIEQLQEHHPNRFRFLGDSGYPLRPWLLTPINNPAPGTPEHRYTNAHTSIRSLIERCNGVLKNRFRCLLKHRILHYSPERASCIINACVVLHNLCTNNNVQLLFDEDEIAVIDHVDFGF